MKKAKNTYTIQQYNKAIREAFRRGYIVGQKEAFQYATRKILELKY